MYPASYREREIAVASITIHSPKFLPLIAIATKRGKLTRIMGPILIVPTIAGEARNNPSLTDKETERNNVNKRNLDSRRHVTLISKNYYCVQQCSLRLRFGLELQKGRVG